MSRNNYAGWLRVRLLKSTVSLRFAALFGSIAKNSQTPHDCDLLLIIQRPDSVSEWRRITSAKKALKKEFYQVWGLPLSITIMTPEEAAETTNFNTQVFGGALIEIVGSMSASQPWKHSANELKSERS